jgi:hypothetical protein
MGKPLYELSHHWREPLATISCKLLDHVVSQCDKIGHSKESFQSEAAFLLLPGIMACMRVQKEERVVDFLRDTARILEPARCAQAIIRRAFQCKEILTAARAERRATGNVDGRPRQVTKEGLVRKTEDMVKDGRCSAAMRGPVKELADMIEAGVDRKDLAPALSLAEQKEIVNELFPRASPDDLNLPEVPDDTPRLGAFTGDDITFVVQRLPPGKAAGVSGWTYGIIRDLVFQHRSRGGPFCQSLAGFFNKLAVGAIDRRLWTPIRNIMIPQPDKPKPRPLGIGEAVIRVFTRCVLNQQGVDIGKKLMPLQFGIGVSGGCVKAARMAQVGLDSGEGQTLVSLDMRIAFNGISNKAMHRGVKKYCPPLLRVFHWMYGQSTDIVSTAGELLGTREKGCSQGEILAAAVFSMGFQPTLLKVSKFIANRSSAGRRNAKTGAVFALMDDLNYVCHYTRLRTCIAGVEKILGEEGFELSIYKCKILGDERVAEMHAARPLPYEVHTDGIKVLGAPVSKKKEFRMEFIRMKKDKMVKPISVLGLLSPDISFKLLKRCINQRFSYLVWVTDREENMQACLDYDSKVDGGFVQICGLAPPPGATTSVDPPATPTPLPDGRSPAELNRIPLTPVEALLILRGLPTSQGGFGMVRYAGIGGEIAAVKSDAMVTELVREFYSESASTTFMAPGIWGRPVIHVGVGSIHYYESNHLPALVDIQVTPQGLDSPDSAVQAGGDETDGRDITVDSRNTPVEHLHAITMNRHAKVAKALGQRLRDSGQKAAAAWFESLKFRGSGCWLNRWVCGYSNQVRGDLFRMALRLRGLVPFLHGRDVPLVCSCGRPTAVDNDLSFHLLHCPHSQYFITHRHDNIVRMLAGELRGDLTEEGGGGRVAEIEVEVPLAAPPPDTAVYTADIVCRLDGNLVAVDVTVANPTAEKYLSRGSSVNTSIATDMRSDEKKVLYQKIRAAHQFIPVAIDATGRIGRNGMEFINHVTQGHPDIRRKILDQIHLICVVHNAKNLISRAGEKYFKGFVRGTNIAELDD